MFELFLNSKQWQNKLKNKTEQKFKKKERSPATYLTYLPGPAPPAAQPTAASPPVVFLPLTPKLLGGARGHAPRPPPPSQPAWLLLDAPVMPRTPLDPLSLLPRSLDLPPPRSSASPPMTESRRRRRSQPPWPPATPRPVDKPRRTAIVSCIVYASPFDCGSPASPPTPSSPSPAARDRRRPLATSDVSPEPLGLQSTPCKPRHRSPLPPFSFARSGRRFHQGRKPPPRELDSGETPVTIWSRACTRCACRDP